MRNEKYTTGYANAIIAKFMGFDIVDVGYAGSEEETEWQRAHEEWMAKVALTQVGRYIVNVNENVFYEWSDVQYHSSWDWLMPCWAKAGEILFDIRSDLLDDKYLEAHRITKSFITACQKVDIGRAYKEIYNAVQFIQWYKKQQSDE